MEHAQYHDFHEGPENEKDEFCGRFPAEKFDRTGKKDEIYQKGQSQEHGPSWPGGRQGKAVNAVDRQGGAGKAKDCEA